jgi:hypothetical protein
VGESLQLGVEWQSATGQFPFCPSQKVLPGIMSDVSAMKLVEMSSQNSTCLDILSQTKIKQNKNNLISISESVSELG